MTRAWPFQARVPRGLASKGILQPYTLSKEAGVEKISVSNQVRGPTGAIPKSAPHWVLNLMSKTRPLCTSAKSNLRERGLEEVEKNSFTALAAKGGHRKLVPSKTVRPNAGGSGEEFYRNGLRTQLILRISVCTGP